MNRFAVLILLAMVMGGCASGQEKLEMYVDNPKYFIKDPDFESYQGKLETLERQYLHKEITYAEYLEKKEGIDNTYDRGVQERSDIILPDQYK